LPNEIAAEFYDLLLLQVVKHIHESQLWGPFQAFSL
jgi:hypothetical protein